MSATNYTPIYLYNSGTATNTPSAANLGAGELAINYADGKLFYKDGSAAVQVIGWKTTPTTAGGTGLTRYTAGDLPYYASGSALSKLAIGSANYVLTSSGTAPQYVAQSTLTVGNATNAINVGTTDNTSSSSTYYPTLVSATSGNNPITTSSTKLSFVPSTGTLTSTNYAGTWSGSLIGLAYGGTNANLTAVAGGVHYSTASATAISAAGTSGQFLISGGTGSPTWTSTPTASQYLFEGGNGVTMGNYGIPSTGGTITLTLPSSFSAGFAGILVVSSTRYNYTPQSTNTVYSISVHGTTLALTTLQTNNGVGGGSSFTVTVLTANTITVTDTSGNQPYIFVSFFGNASFG